MLCSLCSPKIQYGYGIQGKITQRTISLGGNNIVMEAALIEAYISSWQASLFGFSRCWPSAKSLGRSLGLTAGYGLFPTLKISQQVTPKAHYNDCDCGHLLSIICMLLSVVQIALIFTTSDFSEKTPSYMLSGASHFRGSLTVESLSWRKYSFVPTLSESPKSATLMIKLISIL